MNDKEPDESFANFLQRCCPHASQETKDHALGYVAGFNAADPAQVSVHWLFHQMKAEEKIEGERAFRPQGGYRSLLDVIQKRIAKAGVRVRTNTVVQRIAWRAGSVAIDAVSGKESIPLRASRVLVTVPLGVLQARPAKRERLNFLQPCRKKNLIRSPEWRWAKSCASFCILRNDSGIGFNRPTGATRLWPG